jgi:CRISPR-associated endoribonuclease Cas6
MRIHLKIKAKEKTIPFDHQPLMVGTIHKWLEWNQEHGEVSLYSFSQLTNGKPTPKGFFFEDGTSFFFSAHDVGLIKKIISGIQTNPLLFNELEVTDIVIEENPDLSHRNKFFAASPIFIKRRLGNEVKHIIYNDIKSSDYLLETLQTKMKLAGIEDNGLSIKFDTDYPRASTKMLNYNGIKNRASWCPVIIEGEPETKLFAWNVGLGNSTGIGFGAIK